MPLNRSEKPGSPAQIERRSWKLAVRRTFRAFGTDECPDVAASLTFYAVLALVPAAMVAFSVVSLLGRGEETAQIISAVAQSLVPDASTEAIRDVIGQIADARLSGIVLVLGLALTLWAVARYVAALGRGMNRIYGVAEGRTAAKLKIGQLLIALVIIVCVAAIAALLAVSGGIAEAIGGAIGLGETALFVWRIVRWPLLAIVVVFVLAFLYYFAPNLRPARFRWMSLGAAIALVALVLASLGFRLYVSTIADYDRIYGAFAGVIIIALWLWIANMALLLGAEFDAEVERVRQLQAGIHAETQVQVPLRDATRIAKSVRRDRKEAAAARDIRR
ncbi:YihY/virulence factor BrkB family protein [Microbacterium sp. A94]|uniref:YihY/virulence factor BrkB family protein n=1 Tax=Microbacterium sp. A94 TaxID=3450717 RepID=UPI003F4298CA